MRDAVALAGAIRSGRTTAGAAMAAALGAAARSDLGAVCGLEPELGRAAAAVFDARAAQDPARQAVFAGVPLLVKDLGGPFAGLPMRCGSGMLPPVRGNSTLAARFRAAGFLPFGLATSPEFGLSLSSEPACGPVARHPLAPELSPGGSSGGAAAAVAAGIVAIAHATDAGGSIRVPAACCGLVGLKPGRGVMPAGPGFGNHLGGIASELVVSRSVRDTAAALAALAGPDAGFAAPGALAAGAALRIGLVCDPLTDPLRAGVLPDAARSLEQAGHRIVPLDWARLAGLAGRSDAVFRDIVAVNLAELVARCGADPARAEPLTQAVIAHGAALSATAIWARMNDLLQVSYGLGLLLQEVDVLLGPMLSGPPRPLGWHPMSHGDIGRHFAAMAGFAPLATLANIAGVPAITLPFGADPAGLPLPVQLIGPAGGEGRLLALAVRLEAEGRWQHRFPIAGDC